MMTGGRGAKIAHYMYPIQALDKLKKAQAFRVPVYICGVTGSGKTALIEHFMGDTPYLYHSIWEPLSEFDMQANNLRSGIVVLDDLCDADGVMIEILTGYIQRLLEHPDIWVVLISRSRIPKWLEFLRMKYVFTVITEEELLLTREQQEKYFALYGLELDVEQSEAMWQVSQGLPLSMALLAEERGNIPEAVKRGYAYLETHVYDQWERELHDFLLEISIVDSFTLSLTSMITGNNSAAGLIARAEEVGNFFVRRGEDGIWEYRREVLESLRRRLVRMRSTEQIRRLCLKAALYYELHDQVPEALELYRNIHDTEGISRLLAANARKNPADGHYFAMKKYYLELPDDVIANSPELMAGMSMLQSMLMNESESERWYRELTEYGKSATGTIRRDVKVHLLYLDIALPHRGSGQITALLKQAGTFLLDRKAVLPEFSVTSNLPSLMNGGKDFSSWSKHDKELAASIGRMIELTLGKHGNGAVALSLAESFLEKGVDNYETMALVAKGKMQADSGGKIEIGFVAVGQLAWLSILDGALQEAVELLESFEKRACEENPRLLPNLRAFLTRCAIYRGDRSMVEQWMSQAPDENEEFCTLERFRYLTKVRCYMTMGRDRAAYGLVQQLLYYAQQQKRTYIRMETLLLLAILQERFGDNGWLETMQTCITEAESYHFVRLFSREGGAAYRLLSRKELTWTDDAYRKQVLKECRSMASQYPEYLQASVEEEAQLTERALEILRLQAVGNSAKQIAKLLNISVPTVKYHNRETYKKLGVNNCSAAVNEARRRKLI